MNKPFRIALFLTLLSVALQAQNTIERVEPPNWWTGMRHSEVQLLVYGKGIGATAASVEYRGVRLKQSIRVESPNYLFLNLYIGPDAAPGTVRIEFFDDNKRVAAYDWALLAREAGSAGRQGFNSSDVIYMITPDRFANGDPANDRVTGMLEAPDRTNPGGRHGGDIEGIRQHLDYLRDMGFTAIWPNPLLENNMPAYSYHGYAITDFYRIDPRFGSNDSYRRLVQEARAKGLKVVMDMVVNHCGSKHWWMSDLPASDWLNVWDTFTETNHRKTTVQDPYAARVDRKGLVDGWFVQSMPDLNQRNPLMAEYLIQNSLWWIEYAGITGIRMDTYSYPDKDFMSEWAKAIMTEYPNFNIVGEEWSEDPAIVAYWQTNKQNHDGYSSNLPCVMDFPLQTAMITALRDTEAFKAGWLKLYEALAHDFLYPDPLNLMIFADNHDMPRFFVQVNESPTLFRLGLAYLLTMRGIPQVYYGTEIMMTSPPERNDGLIRSDFPGGWPGDAVDAFTGKGLSPQQAETQAFLKKLLNWRKTADAVHRGNTTHFEPRESVYVYFRYTKSQKVMVILNKNSGPYSLRLDRFAEVLQSARRGADVLSGQTFDLTKGVLELPEMGVLVLEVE